jgi:hypothetical protein
MVMRLAMQKYGLNVHNKLMVRYMLVGSPFTTDNVMRRQRLRVRIQY